MLSQAMHLEKVVGLLPAQRREDLALNYFCHTDNNDYCLLADPFPRSV